MYLLGKAIAFATERHEGQYRRYDNEPYINHPLRVSETVRRASLDREVIAASILHDVVEDTDTTLEEISEIFGSNVAKYVDDMTDISKPEDGNRKARLTIDFAHTAQGHPISKTIKIADVLDNLRDVYEKDPRYAQKYCREKEVLLHQSLKEGNKMLWNELLDLIEAIKDKTL